MRLGVPQFGLSHRILSPEFATGITHSGVEWGDGTAHYPPGVTFAWPPSVDQARGRLKA